MAPVPIDDTRARILNAAGPVFALKGFRSATVRELCRAADVNLASVNYHFGDKERLYIETVKEAHRRRFEQVPPPHWAPDTKPSDKLRQFTVALITRMIGVDEEPWQNRLMMREILQPTQACEELVRDFFKPQFGALLDILDEMLPGGVPVARRHQLAFSVVGQCLYYRVADSVIDMLVDSTERQDFYSAEQLGDHITEFTLAALGITDSLNHQFSSRS